MGCTPGSVHLAIDGIGARHGGAATVLQDLISAAESDSRFARVSVFCSPRSQRVFDFPDSSKLTQIECPIATNSRLFRFWWIKRGLSRTVGKIGADVLLCMGGVGNGGPTIPHIAFIQQLLPFSPEARRLCSIPDRVRMKAIFYAMKRSCVTSRGIVVQNCSMGRAVANTFGIEPGRVHVAPSSVRELENCSIPSAQLALMRSATGPKLLYVGSQAAYKNVKVLLDSIESLSKVLVGVTIFLTWPREHPAGGRPGVVCLGYLQGAALSEAYKLADFCVMPSLAETTGLPMLEAMSAGTPVLAADRPYAHDVCEDAAIFFDPMEPADLASKAISILNDRPARDALVEKGLELIARKRRFQPYIRMLDVLVDAALAAGGNKEISK